MVKLSTTDVTKYLEMIPNRTVPVYFCRNVSDYYRISCQPIDEIVTDKFLCLLSYNTLQLDQIVLYVTSREILKSIISNTKFCFRPTTVTELKLALSSEPRFVKALVYNSHTNQIQRENVLITAASILGLFA